MALHVFFKLPGGLEEIHRAGRAGRVAAAALRDYGRTAPTARTNGRKWHGVRAPELIVY